MSKKALVAGAVLAVLTTAAFAQDARVRQPVTAKPGAHAVAPSIEQIGRDQALRSLEEAALAAAAGTRPAARPAFRVGALATPPGIKCFPTCAVDDGRFLAVAGSDLVTLTDPNLDLEIAVPAGTASFQIGIFDGDANEADGSGAKHWDLGDHADYTYVLMADPLGDGTGTTVIDLAPGYSSYSSHDMPDNAWIDFTVTPSAAAMAPSGNYFYVLRIALMNTALQVNNAFKIRTDGVVTVELPAQPFSYIASVTDLPDGLLVYPSFPSPSPTTYDGTFSFYFEALQPQQNLTLWDGDFDRGRFDGTEQDTDDPNTDATLPPWAFVPFAKPEGVAAGSPYGTGNPADDANPAGAGVYFARSPSIRYDLLFPDGQVFANENPSGNQEWERFEISTAPFNPSVMDYSTSSIPAGVYQLRVQGVDMGNLNALFLPKRALCVDADDAPCNVLRPFLLGDTVFFDSNWNGTQDPGEPGIAGVVVNLLDSNGNVIGTTTTVGGGYYSFEVDPGIYTVEVAASNFSPGGPLAGMTSTTGGEHITDTIVDRNVLTYDFGYFVPGGQGCTPGYWKQRQHFDSWYVYSTTDWYDSVFGVPYVKTLLQALAAGGGGEIALGRHATAALLNSVTPGVNYLFSTSQIISMVQAAYASGEYEKTKDLLATQNEIGCPLN